MGRCTTSTPMTVPGRRSAKSGRNGRESRPRPCSKANYTEWNGDGGLYETDPKTGGLETDRQGGIWEYPIALWGRRSAFTPSKEDGKSLPDRYENSDWLSLLFYVSRGGLSENVNKKINILSPRILGGGVDLDSPADFFSQCRKTLCGQSTLFLTI